MKPAAMIRSVGVYDPVKPLLRGVLGKMGRRRKAEWIVRLIGLFRFPVKDVRQAKQRTASAGRAPF